MKVLKKIGLPLLAAAIIIAILYLAASAIGSELILPSPTVIFKEFFGLLKTKIFYRELAMNLWRSFYSFALAFLLAAFFATVMSMSEVAEKLFNPFIMVMRAIPTISVILWVLMIFKSDASPAAISFIVIFPMLYSAVISTVKARDRKLDEVAKVYGIKKSDVIFKMILPDVGERLIPQIASTFAFNVKLIIAGEALSYTKLSLGREMKIANANLETARLLALTVAVVLLSIIAEYVLIGIWQISKRAVYGYTRRKIDKNLR